MREPMETRFDYGRHAVLVQRLPTAEYKAKVWLNCDKGNTQLNKEFREILLPDSFPNLKSALMRGRQMARGATPQARND